jgi:hypothetical protein
MKQYLKSDLDFEKAILFRSIVEVTQNGTLIGAGQIVSHSQYSVKMPDANYMKDECEFTMVHMVH